MNLINQFTHRITACITGLRRKPRRIASRDAQESRGIECIESRIAPANITAIVLGHTLTITGDSAANALIINGDAGDATKFHLSSSTDTINSAGATFDTSTGVTDIAIKMLDGNDSVTFNNAAPITLAGGLTVDGGNGANTVSAIDLVVTKNFSITHGTNATGSDSNTLTNLTVKGNLTINNGNGDSSTLIDRNAAGFCAIYGNVSITSGSGQDFNTILDTNIGKNLTISDGTGDAAGNAGRTWIYNSANTVPRSLIGGNVSITYANGNGVSYDGIWDTEILGNLTYQEGPGTFTNNFDGYQSNLPVSVHGNFSLTGTGAHTVTVGTQYNKTGMVVGKNVSITTGSQADTMTFTKLLVGGSETLSLGGSANTVTTTDMIVNKNLSITNGNNATGTDVNSLTNLTVNGNLTINNGNGDTNTTIGRNAAGFCEVLGNLSITNGTGTDFNTILDTNVGLNVTVNNGTGNAAGVAGTTWIFNVYNSTPRAVIGGNLSVTYLDGNGSGYDGLWDTEILGNANYQHGPGNFVMNFDGYTTSLPDSIHGNLIMTGTGANTVTVGTQYNQTGLVVGGNLRITSGALADTLDFKKLQVEGMSKLMLGNGVNKVTVNDSIFTGNFMLTTGIDADTVNLDTATGTTVATVFAAPVLIKLGAGDDTINEVGSTDAGQALLIYNTFIIHHGSGADVRSFTGSHEMFPFGNSIQYIV